MSGSATSGAAPGGLVPDPRAPGATVPAPAGAGTRREMVLGGMMLAAAAGALWATPRRYQALLGQAKLDALVPKAFDGWSMETTSGLVLPPPDQLSDQLYRDLLTRAYTKPGQPAIMMLIAYGGSQGGVLQVHRPEVCYPAGGYRLPVIASRDVALAPGLAVPARYLQAVSDTRSEQIVYWTRLGSHFPRTWAEQRVDVLKENLAGVVPDGVLVRLSTLATGPVEGLLDGFAAALYRSVGPRMRRVLVGEG